VLHVGLNRLVRELASDEALRIEHGVGRVHRHLVLRGIADEALGVVESDVRRGRSVALIVRDNLEKKKKVRSDRSGRAGQACFEAESL
jgi:hypothetical protein